jgi:hypothetical protein
MYKKQNSTYSNQPFYNTGPGKNNISKRKTILSRRKEKFPGYTKRLPIAFETLALCCINLSLGWTST